MSRSKKISAEKKWTYPADFHTQLKKLWDKGELLAQLINSENSFPKRLTLKGPTSSEISENFEAVRLWAKELMNVQYCRIESILMDHETLMRHEPSWGNEKDQALQDLPLLTTDEQNLFNDLRDNRIRKNLRLEQEFIGFGWIEKVLSRF